MKITKGYLKQLIKEEIKKIEEVDPAYKAGKVKVLKDPYKEEGPDNPKVEVNVREVIVTINGKTAKFSFHETGGPPALGGEDYWEEMTPEEREEANKISRQLANIKTTIEDYTPAEIEKMSSGRGEEVSHFKP